MSMIDVSNKVTIPPERLLEIYDCVTLALDAISDPNVSIFGLKEANTIIISGEYILRCVKYCTSISS